MSKDFNPTSKNLLMLEELILDIKAKRNVLINRKIIIQNSLSNLKNNYKDVDFEGKKFKEIKNKRQNLKIVFNEVELKLKKLNDELILKNKLKLEIEFHLKNNKKLEGSEDLERVSKKILELKVKYSNFSKDRTRISSLRVMACEFIDELENLLK